MAKAQPQNALTELLDPKQQGDQRQRKLSLASRLAKRQPPYGAERSPGSEARGRREAHVLSLVRWRVRDRAEWICMEISLRGGGVIMLERLVRAIRRVYGTRLRTGTDDSGQQTDTHRKRLREASFDSGVTAPEPSLSVLRSIRWFSPAAKGPWATASPVRSRSGCRPARRRRRCDHGRLAAEFPALQRQTVRSGRRGEPSATAVDRRSARAGHSLLEGRGRRGPTGYRRGSRRWGT